MKLPLATVRWQPIAALALLGMVVSAVAVGVILPAIEANVELDQQISDSQALLSRLNAKAAQRGQLAAQLEAIENTSQGADYTFEGETDALAAAGLQVAVNAILASQGLAASSVQIVQQGKEALQREVAVRVEFAANHGQLLEVLHRLEAYRPFIVLDALDIAAPASGDSGGELRLSVRLVAVGFVKGGD